MKSWNAYTATVEVAAWRGCWTMAPCAKAARAKREVRAVMRIFAEFCRWRFVLSGGLRCLW